MGSDVTPKNLGQDKASGSMRSAGHFSAHKKSREFVPQSLFILIALSIFISEALIMALLSLTPPMGVFATAITDAVLVTIFTIPILYLFFYKPLVRHIKSREKAEEELALFATFVEQAEEAIIITSKDGSIEYVNPAFEKIYGYSFDEAIGQNPRILKSGFHDKTFYEEMWSTLLSGNSWKGFIINKAKSGELVEEKSIISPLFDKGGAITHIVGIKRDMTNELLLERQARQSQKMEAIGVMAGGISHDFNNILSAIIGYIDMALDDVPEGSVAYKDLQEALRGGKRAKDLVAQILAFSRPDETRFKQVRLDHVVKESLRLLRASLPASIQIVEEIEDEPLSIMGDSTQMSQVMMNLGANAGHAISGEGVLTIGMNKIEIDETFALTHNKLPAGSYLQWTVSDNGHGMSRETAERIFEPFFTTKEVGKGTGLGLSAAHGIIMSHGGGIAVTSEPGMGATFDIYLPMVSTKHSPVRKSEEVACKGGEKILYIDDEESIVKVVSRGLAKYGYDVTGCVDPAEALMLFKSDPSSFDLVITDLAMPKISGEQVISEVRAIRESLPIILITGYSQDVHLERLAKLGINRQIIKPVSAKDIASAIREVVDTAKTAGG